jgi:hypothetical protein
MQALMHLNTYNILSKYALKTFFQRFNFKVLIQLVVFKKHNIFYAVAK